MRLLLSLCLTLSCATTPPPERLPPCGLVTTAPCEPMVMLEGPNQWAAQERQRQGMPRAWEEDGGFTTLSWDAGARVYPSP